MRHQAHHIAALAANSGNVAQRPVGIVHVTQHHAILFFKQVQRALIGEIAAFTVSDRKAEQLARLGGRRERSIRRFDPYGNVAADEFQIPIAKKSAWKQPALAENLESVADAQNEPALIGELTDGAHYG